MNIPDEFPRARARARARHLPPRRTRRKYLAALLFLAFSLLALERAGLALTPGPDGFHHTGDAVQTASHWPFKVDLFAIGHDMKQLPGEKSRKAVVELATDKRFTLRMLRAVAVERLKKGLRAGYERNGFKDAARIEALLGALTGEELAKGAVVTIAFDREAKRTTLSAPGGSATVEGADFMRATWGIWIGKSDPADMGDRLIADL